VTAAGWATQSPGYAPAIANSAIIVSTCRIFRGSPMKYFDAMPIINPFIISFGQTGKRLLYSQIVSEQRDNIGACRGWKKFPTNIAGLDKGLPTRT
jgi:hypothetical protein